MFTTDTDTDENRSAVLIAGLFFYFTGILFGVFIGWAIWA